MSSIEGMYLMYLQRLPSMQKGGENKTHNKDKKQSIEKFKKYFDDKIKAGKNFKAIVITIVHMLKNIEESLCSIRRYKNDAI